MFSELTSCRSQASLIFSSPIMRFHETVQFLGVHGQQFDYQRGVHSACLEQLNSYKEVCIYLWGFLKQVYNLSHENNRLCFVKSESMEGELGCREQLSLEGEQAEPQVTLLWAAAGPGLGQELYCRFLLSLSYACDWLYGSYQRISFIDTTVLDLALEKEQTMHCLAKSGDHEFCFTILWLKYNHLEGNKEARMENLSLSKQNGKIASLIYGLFQKYQV